MSPEAHKIVEELDKLKAIYQPEGAIKTSQQMPHLARLLIHIADDMDRQTRRIIRLTWALVALTAALLLFTVYLYKDTHQLIQREQQTAAHETKNP